MKLDTLVAIWYMSNPIVWEMSGAPVFCNYEHTQTQS